MTNKSLVTVLSLLSTVTGLFSVKHLVLGKISITLGVVAVVGEEFIKHVIYFSSVRPRRGY